MDDNKKSVIKYEDKDKTNVRSDNPDSVQSGKEHELTNCSFCLSNFTDSDLSVQASVHLWSSSKLFLKIAHKMYNMHSLGVVRHLLEHKRSRSIFSAGYT